MIQSKGLSAVSYLSYFFAPFILPIIILFITKEDFVKRHSKRAIISHLIPVVLGITLAIFFFSEDPDLLNKIAGNKQYAVNYHSGNNRQ